MRVMVIYAHPLDDSFNAAIHRTILTALRESGHDVDDCDLYAENFNPVLSADERRHYHDESRNQAPVADYIRRLRAAEALVFCHPTWCFGLPAILKTTRLGYDGWVGCEYKPATTTEAGLGWLERARRQS